MSDPNDMISRGDAREKVQAATGFDNDHPVVAAIAALPAVTPKVRPLEWQLVAAKEGVHYRAFDPLYGRDVEAPNEATCDAIDQTRAARILAALDLTPAPDAAAIREATARLHKLAYWLDTDAEVLADMDQRDLSDHQHIQAEVNAILALLPKGGA